MARRWIPLVPGDNSRRNFAFARRTKVDRRNLAERARVADTLCSSAEHYNKHGGGGESGGAE